MSDGRASTGGPKICTFGDAVVDVVVQLTTAVVADDDVPATTTLVAGGQAANVAAWAVDVGGSASVMTFLGDDAAGRFVRGAMGARGVDVRSPARPGRTGTVVSLVGPDGSRTMASDRGDAESLTAADIAPEWFEGCSWLHMSGYALFGPQRADTAVQAARLARAAGAAVSVDLSSATLVGRRGPAEVRARLQAVGAVALFANQAEARALGTVDVDLLVIKEGALGASVRSGGRITRLAPAPVDLVRDTTGAGDAFAAGWLVGGPDAAVRAAGQCIRTVGAMPALRRPL